MFQLTIWLRYLWKMANLSHNRSGTNTFATVQHKKAGFAMMNLFLVLYTVLPLSAGLVEMTGMPTPQFSGVSFRFPTEQSCQAAAGAINELGSGPITNADAKAVMESG